MRLLTTSPSKGYGFGIASLPYKGCCSCKFWTFYQANGEMAVKNVHFGEIVEVTFKLPGEGYKVHPALVVSGKDLQDDEDGIFYAVLISSKNYLPQYTIELKDEWLTRPLNKQSYFVTHFMTYFNPEEVTQSYRTSVKSE